MPLKATSAGGLTTWHQEPNQKRTDYRLAPWKVLCQVSGPLRKREFEFYYFSCWVTCYFSDTLNQCFYFITGLWYYKNNKSSAFRKIKGGIGLAPKTWECD